MTDVCTATRSDRGNRRPLLILLACLAFVACISIELTAQASSVVGVQRASAQDARDHHGEDHAQWHPAHAVPVDDAWTAVEPEGLEGQAAVERIEVRVSFALTMLARRTGAFETVPRVEWIPQPFVARTSARGPPVV